MISDLKDRSQLAVLNAVVQQLEQGGIDEARRNAEWLVGEVAGHSRARLYAYPEREMTEAQLEILRSLVARRLQHEPVQYIVGHADFYGLRLHVTPAVLIPRPETEQVVETALAWLAEQSAPRVLDIGTGSGCIPLAFKHERPDAEVFACDISEEALVVARRNADEHGLAIHFFLADVLGGAFLDVAPGNLDLLISNPPYVALDEAESLARHVRDHEPHLALFAGEDPLLFYRVIIRHAAILLAPGGLLIFETDAYHAEEVVALMQASPFEQVALNKDLAGLPRIVRGQRPEAQS
ncbi:MAG TPA: peptide chain release factor N(5)-glutamine methyltransferase [Rhodothermales bacterium]|nr:peptide chain release factor N(5)-glutamine methyltransferase [Rhodothermales bacterium]